MLLVLLILTFLIIKISVSNHLKSGPHILLLGDSITSGNQRIYSYRRELWHLLNDASYTFNFVGSNRTWRHKNSLIFDFDADHEAYWGYEVNQINEILPKRIESYPIDIALIHLGTNDISRGHSIESTIDDLNKTIEILREKNPQIIFFLAQIIPIKGQDVTFFNQQLPLLAERLFKEISPIYIVNQQKEFNEHSMLLDKFHPNPIGEAKIAQSWFLKLKTVL